MKMKKSMKIGFVISMALLLLMVPSASGAARLHHGQTSLALPVTINGIPYLVGGASISLDIIDSTVSNVISGSCGIIKMSSSGDLPIELGIVGGMEDGNSNSFRRITLKVGLYSETTGWVSLSKVFSSSNPVVNKNERPATSNLVKSVTPAAKAVAKIVGTPYLSAAVGVVDMFTKTSSFSTSTSGHYRVATWNSGFIFPFYDFHGGKGFKWFGNLEGLSSRTKYLFIVQATFYYGLTYFGSPGSEATTTYGLFINGAFSSAPYCVSSGGGVGGGGSISPV
ncbi:MAG: hypothetical protein D6732_03865 [Methanobacteriota archaeon]|nr:MAG: hypothetical protein D6732_03865 [Euryarchaeota archaeon]